MKKSTVHVSALTIWSILAASLAVGQVIVEPQLLPNRAGVFVFKDAAVLGGTMKVWYCRPPKRQADARIVFVMHGSDPKTAEQACRVAEPYVSKLNAVIVAPQFSADFYPSDSYTFAGMVDGKGLATPKNRWGVSVIERLFDAIRRDLGLSASTYDIVGFSGGGQFVHRLVLCAPETRYRRAVAASPGRYLLPTFAVQFPYGLDKAPSEPSVLRRAFERDFILLLGDQDTVDRAREDEAIAQGANRFARGLRFFATATEEAQKIGAPLRWQLHILHGSNHDPVALVRRALDLL